MVVSYNLPLILIFVFTLVVVLAWFILLFEKIDH